jgi:homoserine acetyltransferase
MIRLGLWSRITTNRTHTRAQVTKDIENANTARSNDANDTIRQIKAMMALNVAAPFGDLLERAAAAVKAEVVVIVGSRDHVVARCSPMPGRHARDEPIQRYRRHLCLIDPTSRV